MKYIQKNQINLKLFLNLCLSITLTALAIVMFQNCSKTSIEQNIPKQEIGDGSAEIIEHILQVKSKLELHHNNPDLKSGELISADSAIWEIESQLNFNFCYNNIDILQKSLEEFEVIMPLNSQQKIAFTELVVLYYDIIIDSIQSKMTNLTYQNKRLLLVDLEQTGSTAQGDKIISVKSLIGNQQNIVLHDDNWWYGENYGTCNGNYGPEDAATQLDARVTNAMLPAPPGGGRWKFTNVKAYGPVLPKKDKLDETPDNYLDYKIFFATTENNLIIDFDVKCLSPFEMNFYKSQYFDYVDTAEAKYPGKKFSECMIVGKENVNPYQIYHNYTIFVGNRFVLYDYSIDDIMEVE